MPTGFNWIIRVFLIMLLSPALAAESLPREQIKGLDEQVQDIKKDVLAISSELSLLEEKLLYPSNTQIALFISVEQKTYIPDAIQIKLNERDISHHIYSFKEVGALHRGGVQRIYTGNIKSGEHQLTINVIGRQQDSDMKKESANFTIKKGVGAKLVEISLGSSDAVIAIKER